MYNQTVTWCPMLVVLMLVFNGGIQIRVAWWIGQALEHDADSIGDVSLMCWVKKKTMKKTTRCFGTTGNVISKIYEIQVR